MVAETAQIPPPKRGRPPLRRVSLVQRAKARTLYLVEQLTTREIADQTGIHPNQLRNLISREGWSTSKKSIKAQVLAKANARTQEAVKEVVEAVAIQSESLSIGTLAKAADTLDRTDVNAARDLQAYSQAAKNFVGIARQARGLDIEQQGERQGALVVFLGDLPRVGREERRVEAIDLPPTQCPIPALPMPQGEALPAGEGKDTPIATD